jgi:hypothetical protein
MTPAFTAAGLRYFCTMMDVDSGFLPLSLTLGNTKSVSLLKGVLSRQAGRNPAGSGCMGTGAFDAFDFGTLNLPHTYARLTYITRSWKSRSAHVRASNSETRSAVAASLRVSVRLGSVMFRRISNACVGVIGIAV